MTVPASPANTYVHPTFGHTATGARCVRYVREGVLVEVTSVVALNTRVMNGPAARRARAWLSGSR